jgi:hypothetical protein
MRLPAHALYRVVFVKEGTPVIDIRVEGNPLMPHARPEINLNHAIRMYFNP